MAAFSTQFSDTLVDEWLLQINTSICEEMMKSSGQLDQIGRLINYYSECADEAFAGSFAHESRPKRVYYTNITVLETRRMNLRAVSGYLQTVPTVLGLHPAEQTIPIVSPLHRPQAHADPVEYITRIVNVIDGMIAEADVERKHKVQHIEQVIDGYCDRIDQEVEVHFPAGQECAEKRRIYVKRQLLESRAEIIASVNMIQCGSVGKAPSAEMEVDQNPDDDNGDGNDGGHNADATNPFLGRLGNTASEYAPHCPNVALGSAFNSGGRNNAV